MKAGGGTVIRAEEVWVWKSWREAASVRGLEGRPVWPGCGLIWCHRICWNIYNLKLRAKSFGFYSKARGKIHFDIWKNQYNIVKLNKIKLRGKKKARGKLSASQVSILLFQVLPQIPVSDRFIVSKKLLSKSLKSFWVLWGDSVHTYWASEVKLEPEGWHMVLVKGRGSNIVTCLSWILIKDLDFEMELCACSGGGGDTKWLMRTELGNCNCQLEKGGLW